LMRAEVAKAFEELELANQADTSKNETEPQEAIDLGAAHHEV